MPDRTPPWWQTMGQDPWAITAAKALLGEREVEGMRRGEILPWVETISPLLFLGRKGPELPRMPALTQEQMLPPETKVLLDAVRSYEPPASPEQYKTPELARKHYDYQNWADYMAQNPGWAQHGLPGSKFNTAFINTNQIPSAPRPGAPLEGMPPVIKITPEDLPFGQQKITITPADLPYVPTPAEPPPKPDDTFSSQLRQEITNLGLTPPPATTPEVQADWLNYVKQYMSGKGQSGDMHQMPGGMHFGEQEAQRWYAPDYNFEFGPNKEVPGRFMSNPQSTPPPNFDQEFGQFYSTGGVVGMNIGDPFVMPGPSLQDEYISMMPNYTYIPSGDFGAFDIPASPDFPEYAAPDVSPEVIDSRDFIGGANYYYVAPEATGVPTPPANYAYNPNLEEGRDQETHYQAIALADKLAKEMGSSLPPATKAAPDEQVKMLEQWAAMQEAARRFDENERRTRLRQQQIDAATRFGPPPQFSF